MCFENLQPPIPWGILIVVVHFVANFKIFQGGKPQLEKLKILAFYISGKETCDMTLGVKCWGLPKINKNATLGSKLHGRL
jgi:hypothetical protein